MSNDKDLGEIVAGSSAFERFSRASIAMIITDPRVKDNPIIYVNDAFERTTGYSRTAAIGRNCRFLQGEATQKEAVDKIRAAVAHQREVAVDILNYRASGEPFMNRLIISPVHDENDDVIFYIGIQKELQDGDLSEPHSISDAHLDVIRSRVRQDLAIILGSISEQVSNRTDLINRAEALPRRLECLQLVYEEMRFTDRQWVRKGLDLGSLLSRAANAVANSEGRPGVRFVQMIETLEVNLETATRVALLLSEILHNAFEHAFFGLDQGYVELRVVRLAAGGLRMTVSDDGVGIPSGTNWPSHNSYGGRLVASLLDGLDATINVARGAAGTVVMIDVPVGSTDN